MKCISFKTIYRSLIIFFFKLFYKKITILKKKDYKYLKIKKIYRDILLFQIPDGKIFTNSVNDTAFIYKDQLIEKPSYQYRNSKLANIKKNFVLKNGTPKFLKKYDGIIVSLLSSGPCKHNYGHWILEILTRLSVLKKIIKSTKECFFYVPSLEYSFQKDTFQFLNINKNRIIESHKNKFISGSKVICTTHPFKNDFTKINRELILKTKSIFLPYGKNSKINCYDKIFINRDYNFLHKTTKNIYEFRNYRILLNHAEIEEYLKKKGFYTFTLSNLRLADQIKIFSKAKIIVSMLGAELSNLIFCNPGTKVIEIKNLRKTKDFFNLSKKCGLKHKQIELKTLYPSNIPQNGILICPLKKIDLAINKI